MNVMSWLWLGGVVLFGAVEAATAGLVSIWFAAGAVAGLIAAWLGAGVPRRWCCSRRCPRRRWR